MVICLLLISTTLYDWSDSSDRLCTTAIVSVAVLAGMLYTLLGIFYPVSNGWPRYDLRRYEFPASLYHVGGHTGYHLHKYWTCSGTVVIDVALYPGFGIFALLCDVVRVSLHRFNHAHRCPRHTILIRKVNVQSLVPSDILTTMANVWTRECCPCLVKLCVRRWWPSITHAVIVWTQSWRWRHSAGYGEFVMRRRWEHQWP